MESKIKKLKVQVNYKKYDLFMTEKTYQDNLYMNNINVVRKNVNYSVKHSLYNTKYRKNGSLTCVCAYCFISSSIDNPTYVLKRLNETQFLLEKVDM